MDSQVKIRVQLIDQSGNQLASTTEIIPQAEDTIDCLVGRVRAPYPAQLWCLEPNQLRAFPNIAVWKNKGQPLQARDRANSVLLLVGRSKDVETEELEPIAVLVPINPPLERWSTAFLATSIWLLQD